MIDMSKIEVATGNCGTHNEKWLDDELQLDNFQDKRLGKRCKKLMTLLWNNIGQPIPFACQDWANTKAAYRFLSNNKVNEKHILQGHFESTKQRFETTGGTILILHDTTEFSYNRIDKDKVGITKLIPSGINLFGQPIRYTKCGVLMHSSLAITPDGLPLGIAAIKFWTRKVFKGTNALKKHVNTTRLAIENKESYRWLENVEQSNDLLNAPNRCVHIADREGDIYELFCKAITLNTNFVFRICADRLAEDGNTSIETVMSRSKTQGYHTVRFTNPTGKETQARLKIKYHKIKILPPQAKQKNYPALELTVIQAIETKTPKGRERIIWKLITNIEINTVENAIEKLDWYSTRWKIETFHKILKSGCKAEDSKLRTAHSIIKMLAIFCVLSWRIFWMTMINRCNPNVSPIYALTQLEIKLLDQLIRNNNKNSKVATIKNYIIKIAKLGGYLARATDPPPGNTVMWRGLNRLTDIQLGFDLATQLMGN